MIVMKTIRTALRSDRRTDGRLALAALASSAAISFAAATTASALPCIQERFGTPLNCTANDIRITAINNVVITDDGCTSKTDTVTFNATLTVVTTATSRYDIGLFIGTDGEQALVGDCRVLTLPTGPSPFRDLDGDLCGDTSSSMIVNLPVTSVTVACVDANQNHKLDVANCTSWQQNSNETCTGPVDVQPGTAAKCNCPLTPLDIDIFVPEPLCENDAECADRAIGCNDAICDPMNDAADGFGCVQVPESAECQDNKFCNGREICTPAGTCAPGTPIDCSDGISCTVDDCSEQQDRCTHTTDDRACDNHQFCDGSEICSPFVGCQPGTPVDCGDSISCTVDACDEATDKCTHAPSDNACSNGEFCDGVETCTDKGCKPGAPVDCSDPFACTTDVCDDSIDACRHTPDDTDCADGVFCNGVEICSPTLGCRSGPPPVCSGSTGCAVDRCSEQADACESVPDDTLCDDGNACTDDLCAPSGECSHTNNDAPCSDGSPCTPHDQCVAGQCTGTGTVCGDGIVETGCGETCDPDDHEICNNLIDDDGDGLIDCADPDCAEAPEPTCTDACQPAPPCVPLARDPAIIYIPELEQDLASEARERPSVGRFTFHGRMVPESAINPLVDGFVVSLTNANGVIYSAEVKPVDLQASGEKRWFYRAPDDGSPVREGIAKLRVRRRVDRGEVGFAIRVTAYGDFSAATLPVMTTQVYFGDDVAYVTAEWTSRPGRWTLFPADYDGQ
ncbi:MAG TPA: hypothetical protein VN634_21785 [Candidatus Limnocylindrales bacterium]|nr:hypothetical protein [Candidatus Limnocylindrales bacterium]